MNTKNLMSTLAATLVVASTGAGLLAQDAPSPAPLTDQQLQRIRPIIQASQAEGARAQARLAECQRELEALYARYDLDDAAARKLQDEIVELQRRLLTTHHRMQIALRATVNAEQFDRLRRRLQQITAPSPAPDARPAAPPQRPARQP
jgi:hypothetical protein